MITIEKIPIVTHKEILYINAHDIVFLESVNDHVVVHFVDSSTVHVRKQLAKLQDVLPEFFVRLTQCVLINKFFINSIDKREKLVFMQGGSSIKYTIALGKLVERIGRISNQTAMSLPEQRSARGRKSILEIA